MDNSSEYQIPIFVSSTHYNLVDLRAELCRFLGEIGYRPILSSSEGFPDSSPKLEPWESCLKVLDNCFLMILVIDGRYGEKLSWPNFEDVLAKIDVSPTHAEYKFAHNRHKRILVFIRKELMVHYQSFRRICKQYKTEANREKELKKVLPDYVDYETLKFIKEVKTTKPIPWIKEFDDVTQVKREVQRKMINELAEVYLLKERKLENVIEIFNRTVDELSPAKQKEILNKITATKELTEENKKLTKLNTDLTKAKKDKKTEKVKKLEAEIQLLNKKMKEKARNETEVILNSEGKLRINDYGLGGSGSLPISGGTFITGSVSASTLGFISKCDKCKKTIKDELGTITMSNGLTKCYSCMRNLCKECWPNSAYTVLGICPDCAVNNLGGFKIAK